MIKKLVDNNIECRPIVTGDFTQNEVMKFLDFEIYGDLKNAKLLHTNGLFVGNHHKPLKNELIHLKNIINS